MAIDVQEISQDEVVLTLEELVENYLKSSKEIDGKVISYRLNEPKDMAQFMILDLDGYLRSASVHIVGSEIKHYHLWEDKICLRHWKGDFKVSTEILKYLEG